jgi:hypothetical protein
MSLILNGVSVKTFDAVVPSSPLNGTTFAMPARAVSLVWQTFFATSPTSITINLEASEDNVHWDSIDSSTVAAGEVRTFAVLGVKFVRGSVSALVIGPGAELTMMLTAKGY